MEEGTSISGERLFYVEVGWENSLAVQITLSPWRQGIGTVFTRATVSTQSPACGPVSRNKSCCHGRAARRCFIFPQALLAGSDYRCYVDMPAGSHTDEKGRFAVMLQCKKRNTEQRLSYLGLIVVFVVHSKSQKRSTMCAATKGIKCSNQLPYRLHTVAIQAL